MTLLRERQEAVADPDVVRCRGKVDRDSELHYDLDKAHGTAPPRVAMSGKGDVTSAAEFHRYREAKGT